MRINSIDNKDPAEVIPVTFDFTKLVSSIDSAVVSVTVKNGTDAAVGTMPLGANQIAGTVVKQLIQNGLDDVSYLVRCDIVKGSEKFALATYLTGEALS